MQAISSNTNVALNKPIYFSENFVLNKNYGAKTTKVINDGSANAYNYAGVLFRDGQSYLTIDLLSHYNLDEVKLWQYYLDGRTYSDMKIQVSQNGVDYYTIFDTNIDGTYPETSSGKTITVPNDIYI